VLGQAHDLRGGTSRQPDFSTRKTPLDKECTLRDHDGRRLAMPPHQEKQDWHQHIQCSGSPAAKAKPSSPAVMTAAADPRVAETLTPQLHTRVGGLAAAEAAGAPAPGANSATVETHSLGSVPHPPRRRSSQFLRKTALNCCHAEGCLLLIVSPVSSGMLTRSVLHAPHQATLQAVIDQALLVRHKPPPGGRALQ
jgi:hypothetical protein